MKFNSCLAAFAALGLTSSLHACGDSAYIGSICTTAATFCPQGTVEANGQTLPLSQYQAYYSLVGTNYGGDGRTTVGVPDLRGRTAVGLTNNVSGATPVVLGTMRGKESVTLSVAQMPVHDHALSNGVTLNVPVSSNTANNKLTPDADYSYMAGTAGGPAGAAMWTNTMTAPVNVKGTTAAGMVSVNGGSAPVTILPPQLGVKQCVVVEGLYPPRP